MIQTQIMNISTKSQMFLQLALFQKPCNSVHKEEFAFVFVYYKEEWTWKKEIQRSCNLDHSHKYSSKSEDNHTEILHMKE